MVGWGNYYEPAGYSPGRFSKGAARTGLLEDDQPWGWDLTGSNVGPDTTPARTSRSEYAGMLFVHDLLRRPGRRVGVLHGPVHKAGAGAELGADMDGSVTDEQAHLWLQEIADDGLGQPALRQPGAGRSGQGGDHRWRLPAVQDGLEPAHQPGHLVAGGRQVHRADADQGHLLRGLGHARYKGMLRAYAELPTPVVVLNGKGFVLHAGRWPSPSADFGHKKRPLAPPPKGGGFWPWEGKRAPCGGHPLRRVSDPQGLLACPANLAVPVLTLPGRPAAGTLARRAVARRTLSQRWPPPRQRPATTLHRVSTTRFASRPPRRRT